jgi:iron-sulfur cluster repair protein YtfE (RIC family)
MDAFKLLTQDHDELRRLLEELEASPRLTRARHRLFDTLREDLDLHTQAEKEVLYPALTASASPELQRLARAAVEEHRAVEDLLEELADLGPDDEDFEAKLALLRENVLDHIGEEEREMFVEARKELERDRLEQLGRELAERKEALKAQPALG